MAGGRNGSGEKLYFYSGKIEAKGGEAGSGIGGSFKGRGRDIYIYGGDISATGGDGGAGIGGGCWTSLQDMDGDTAAYNINIYGGKINAHGGYNGAGIGGGQSSRRAISPSPAARSRRTVRTARPSAADAGVTVRTSP